MFSEIETRKAFLQFLVLSRFSNIDSPGSWIESLFIDNSFFFTLSFQNESIQGAWESESTQH